MIINMASGGSGGDVIEEPIFFVGSGTESTGPKVGRITSHGAGSRVSTYYYPYKKSGSAISSVDVPGYECSTIKIVNAGSSRSERTCFWKNLRAIGTSADSSSTESFSVSFLNNTLKQKEGLLGSAKSASGEIVPFKESENTFALDSTVQTTVPVHIKAQTKPNYTSTFFKSSADLQDFFNAQENMLEVEFDYDPTSGVSNVTYYEPSGIDLYVSKSNYSYFDVYAYEVSPL